MTYTVSATQMTLLVILAIWEMSWKGVGLWRSARCKQPAWFIAMLVINSAGILPIVYLYLTRQRKRVDNSPYIKTPMVRAN